MNPLDFMRFDQREELKTSLATAVATALVEMDAALPAGLHTQLKKVGDKWLDEVFRKARISTLTAEQCEYIEYFFAKDVGPRTCDAEIERSIMRTLSQ